MKYSIVKNKNSYSKIFGASIVAFFMTMTAISIVAIGNGPGTPPEQTIELGDPKMEDMYKLGENWLDLIGSNTPVWINSSDTDGDGADYIEYTLYYSDKDPLVHGWDNEGTFYVYDNDGNDEDERDNYISVKLFFYKSCFHEIHAKCFNKKGQMSTNLLDFLVDADAPSNLDFDYIGPTYIKDNVRYINCRTIKRINASDTGCIAGVAGVNRIEWEVERWIGNTLVEVVNGIVYDNQDNDFEDDLVKVTGDNDKDWGRISMNVQLKKNCTHYIYHQAFDNLTNAVNGKKELNRADVDPPITNRSHPEIHGYIEIDEDESFIKTNMPVILEAEDRPNKDPWKICASGLEAMFWRYEFDGHYYPEEGDPHGYGFPIQTGADLAETYGYTDPAIIGNDWFRIEGDKVEIKFFEECRHDLFYWSKDNVWKNEDIHHHIYYVDDTPPVIELINPDTHGFVEIDEDEGFIKPFIEVKLVAEDLGKCISGVESIFWRFEFEGDSYPDEDIIHPFPVITGDALQALYDYNEGWIINYDWYKIDAEEAIVWFEEQCTHKLFYWTKDNLSNHGDLYDFTYYVDDTPPELQKDHPEHGFYDPENYLFLDGPFNPLYPVTEPWGWWHELYPEYCNEIYVSSWHDTGPVWHGGKALVLYYDSSTGDGWVQYNYKDSSEWDEFRANFADEGWTVDFETHVTPALLSNYDALFVLTPWANIPNYEVVTIINWVEAGGQLLITQNDNAGYANEITSGFGITYNSPGVDEWDMEYFANDMLTKMPNDLEEVYGSTVQDMTVTGEARELGWGDAYQGEDCYLAMNERAGKGIVIAIGEEYMWQDDYFEGEDNEELMDNVLYKFWDHSIRQLSPCDNIDITFEDETVVWYHVEDVTITLWIENEQTEEIIYVDFEDGYYYKDEAMFNPLNTNWHEIYPAFSNSYTLDDWIDNGDGYLSAGDAIYFRNAGGWFVWGVYTDIIVKEEPYLKACSQIDLTAFDEHDCASGVECIFWRYEYGCGDYPKYGDPYEGLFKIVTGAQMQEFYNYWEPEIINHDWYVYDRAYGIHFNEQCLHKLYYFAKDNVCNHGPIHLQKYHVDEEPPILELGFPDEGVVIKNAKPTNVALFKDIDPWGFTSNEIILNNHVIPYTIYDSSDIGVVDLSSFSRVIIASDQPQAFYDAVEANQAWFENYAANGGILQINAADQGWQGGLWNTMPGGFTHISAYLELVDIAMPGHPILTDPNIITDSELDNWNYATHGYFIASLPSGSQVVLDTTTDDPVLVISPWGSGQILISTQTLEWAFGYGYSKILENVILYGQEIFIKCGTKFFINASDDEQCDSGVESIFWRYENETGKYPEDGIMHPYQIVDGEDLKLDYGYTDPAIVDNIWYRIDGDQVEVWFHDNCTHNLTYFAKDNVCNPSDIKTITIKVDCAPPESKKTIGEPKWWDEDEGLWWVTGDTPFSIRAEDKIVPCAVGVDYLEVSVYHSCYNGAYTLSGSITIYDNDPNDEDPAWGIIVYNFTLSDFDWRECWYKIVWRAVDKLGNGEEHAHIQYHKRDDTPPHAIILKPTDGWYTDGSAIPAVVLSEDISGVHNGCDIWDDCAVGIEDGSTADAYLLDIFPAIKKVWLDTTNLKYDADAHEYIGNMVIPDPSGIPDGVVLLVVLPEDRLGNNWTTLEEAIHIALMQLLIDFMTECCVIEGLMDLLADFIIDQNIVFLGIDNTPPEVEIIEPENGDDVGIGPIDMEVQAIDVLSGINLGTQMHVTLADINIGALLYNDVTDQWEGSLSIPMEVPSGTQELVASIADIAGCIGSDMIYVDVAPRPGPTTSGTDVQPDPSMITIEGDGEDLTITATVHSTIDFVAGAEYFIQDTKPEESDWGTGTSLNPVDGDWGETMEDVTGMFNTDEWEPGTYICWVHGIDESGRWGAFDEEEFSVVLETHWRPIFVRIIEPDDDDGYDTFETEPCDDKYVQVVVDAHYWDDPFYDEIEGLDVTIWLDDPYGAPDQFYEVYQEGNYFFADIPVFWYSSGSTLNVWAKAEDEYFNKEYDDSKFDVITTVDFDLWLEEGWNGPINLAVLGCSDATLDVLASIDPYWDFIFEVGTWDNYWYNQDDPETNGGPLQNIDRESWYWIHMLESARFFIDNNPPLVNTTYPEDGYIFENNQCLDGFGGWACDLETGIKEVKLVIFDNDTKEYWNGTGWTEEYTELDCDYDDVDYEWYCEDSENLDLTYKSGHEIDVIAKATDNGGCSNEELIWFMFIDDNEPEIWIEYPDFWIYECGEPDEIWGYAYDDECETIVTDVIIEICDDDAGTYWDGDCWVGDPTYLPCDYDPMTTVWEYTGTIPEWIHDHEFVIVVYAYDAADNVGDDDIWFVYDCPVYGSISGTVYYYGEPPQANTTIWLALAPFSDESIPIDSITIPWYEYSYPILGTFEFTGLEDGTYWVGGFMDWNDNMGVDAWEPMGFAVNKSNWPDYMEIYLGNHLVDKDVRLFDPEPNIDLEKFVWDEDAEEWVDTIYIEQYDNVKFNISIHNDGIAAPLIVDYIRDVLPEGFDYEEGAMITLIYPDGTYTWSQEPEVVWEDDYYVLTWTFEPEMILFECNWIYIEFETTTYDCDDEEPFENYAFIFAGYPAWDLEEYYDDEGYAYVWIPCPCECDPYFEVFKHVFDGEFWDMSLPVRSGDTVRFNLSLENQGYGDCDLTEIRFEDEMDPGLSYADEMTVEAPDGLTYTFEMTNDKLFWNFTGVLEPDESIFIEYNAYVDYISECETIYNWLDVFGYFECPDYHFSNDAYCELWDYYCD